MAITLDEYLDREEIAGIETLPDEEEGDYRYKITSLDAADWAFRKLKQLKAEKAEYIEFARVQRERIDEWLEGVCGPIDGSVTYFEGLIREWASAEVLGELAEVQDWSKVRHKTLSTPNGKVSARKSVNGQFVTSEEGRELAVETLLRVRPDLLMTTYKVAASPLEDARDAGTARLNDRGEYEVIDANGEFHVLPGVYREGRGRISFTVATT